MSLQKEGLIILENFFDQEFVNKINNVFHPIYENNKNSINEKMGCKVIKENVQYISFPAAISKEAVKFVTNEKIISYMEDYLKSKVILSYLEAYRTVPLTRAQRYNYNTPGVFSGWHSDANLITSRKHRMMSVMLYLSNVDEKSGPLDVVLESQNYGYKKRVWLDEEIDSAKVKKICGDAGTVSIFDMEGIHRAGIPIKKKRDVIRASYSPENGYKEFVFLSNFSLPKDLSEKQRFTLQIGENFILPEINNENFFKKYCNKFYLLRVLSKIPFFSFLYYKYRIYKNKKNL